jgi:hypothetical protein
MLDRRSDRKLAGEPGAGVIEVRTAQAASCDKHIPIADAFRARAEARGVLVAAGELDLHDAVDALLNDALRDGLVQAIGMDAVQAIMATAFRSVP